MKTKYYWKVVSIGKDGEFYSALETDPKCKLTYKIGKITNPKLGKIFVFLTRESARIWKSDHYHKNKLFIVQVECIGKVEKAIDSACVVDSFSSKKLFWKNYLRGLRNSYFNLPYNTYYADAVIPIKKSH